MTEPVGDKALAEVVRRRRKELGDSQEDLGYKAGLTGGTISRIELASVRPEWHTVRAVAKAMGMRLSDLGAAIEAIER